MYGEGGPIEEEAGEKLGDLAGHEEKEFRAETAVEGDQVEDVCGKDRGNLILYRARAPGKGMPETNQRFGPSNPNQIGKISIRPGFE